MDGPFTQADFGSCKPEEEEFERKKKKGRERESSQFEDVQSACP